MGAAAPVFSILTAFRAMIKNTHKKPSAATWSGRFAEPVSERVQRYTASVGFDQRLAEHDIRGSLAHARMLAACGVISRRDLAAIESGMRTILAEIRSGRFKWSLAAEDVHLNIERRLTALAGDATTRWRPTCACGCATQSMR
jgi:argininosuccinate lyase